MSAFLGAVGFEGHTSHGLLAIGGGSTWWWSDGYEGFSPLFDTWLRNGDSGQTAGEAPQYIRGQVLDVDGIGAQRLVIAIERETGRAVGTTMSSAGGTFVLRPRTTAPCILVAVPLLEEQLNVVALDNILPVPD